MGPSLPLGRAGTAAEVAASIRWLCLPESSYVTGAVLDVSGGR
jgi:NAD(P)-dependent dehydrogenase (short-subunit alcohol dehydrogenase family)